MSSCIIDTMSLTTKQSLLSDASSRRAASPGGVAAPWLLLWLFSRNRVHEITHSLSCHALSTRVSATETGQEGQESQATCMMVEMAINCRQPNATCEPDACSSIEATLSHGTTIGVEAFSHAPGRVYSYRESTCFRVLSQLSLLPLTCTDVEHFVTTKKKGSPTNDRS